MEEVKLSDEGIGKKIAVITGANTGLGFEVAKDFTSRGIKVVLACRNKEKARVAINQIKRENPEADLDFIPLNLGDLKSVQQFIEDFGKTYNHLDILINNAGVMIPPFSKTKDGFELQMGVNYFGHFLLTLELLPLLEKSGGRVVQLSSIAHKNGTIDFENLNAEKSYDKMTAYSQSKLACLMFALELNRRLKLRRSRLVSVAAHPGVSRTELGRHISKFWYYLLYPLFLLFTHGAKKGAQPIIAAALDESAVGGEYYGPQGFNEMVGKPGKAKIEKQALDESVAKKLWEISKEKTDFIMQEATSDHL